MISSKPMYLSITNQNCQSFWRVREVASLSLSRQGSRIQSYKISLITKLCGICNFFRTHHVRSRALARLYGIHLFSIVILMLFSQSMLAAQPLTPTQQLQQQLASIHTMQADFTQTTTANGKIVQQSNGNMALSRPDKFYWRIHGLSDQTIVANGKTLWIYDKDLAQVTVQSMQHLQPDVPGLLLAGSFDYIQQHYTVERVKHNGSQQTFKLIPLAKQAAFQYALLTINNHMPQQLQFIDQLDQITTLRFTQVNLNKPLAATLFEFVPPTGVDVITQQN